MFTCHSTSCPDLSPVYPFSAPFLSDADHDETVRSSLFSEKGPARDEMITAIKPQIMALAERTNKLISTIHTWAAHPELQGIPLQVEALHNSGVVQLHMKEIVIRIERLDAHFALRPTEPLEGTIDDDLELLSKAKIIDSIGKVQFHELGLIILATFSSYAIKNWLGFNEALPLLHHRYDLTVIPSVKRTLVQNKLFARVFEEFKTLLETETSCLPLSISSQLARGVNIMKEQHLSFERKLHEEALRCRAHLQM